MVLCYPASNYENKLTLHFVYFSMRSVSFLFFILNVKQKLINQKIALNNRNKLTLYFCYLHTTCVVNKFSRKKQCNLKTLSIEFKLLSTKHSVVIQNKIFSHIPNG